MISRMTQLVTVNAAAKRLALHPETLRRWIQAGRIPAVRLPNGRLRITEAELEKLLAGGPAA